MQIVISVFQYLDEKIMSYLTLSFYLFLFATLSQGQVIPVNLTTRTTLDDEGLHVTPFYDEPIEDLELPNIDVSNARFFDIFYSWDIKDDQNISVMVLKTENADLLYIDTNNDEDLTNDNSPHIFPFESNDFTFNIVYSNDSKQFVKIRLRRKHLFSDSLKQSKIDSLFYDLNGNLKQNIAMLFAMKSPNFTGKIGTYYLDYRITLSRGEIILSDESYEIGLFDYTNNGLFNDIHEEDGDVIIIDLDRDGKLSYSNFSEVFYLYDVFEIKGKCYKLTTIDPYGRFFDLKKTDSRPTFRFLKHRSDISSNHNLTTEFELDPSFWNLEFTDLNGQKFKANSLINKFILLNFWGEWCKPCIMEIPEIVAINKNYKNDIVIISFLKTNNLHKAKNVIDDKQMDWYHAILEKEIQKQFNIKGYPTNILISKDGKVLLRKNQITRFDIAKFIK